MVARSFGVGVGFNESSWRRLEDEKKRLDEKEEVLLAASKALDAMRNFGAEVPAENIVEYENAEEGYSLVVENLGDDPEKLQENLLHRYVELRRHGDEENAWEGFYSDRKGDTAIGHFRYVADEVEYFGRVENDRFVGDMLTRLSKQEKIVTQIVEGQASGMSKFVHPWYNKYCRIEGGQISGGEALFTVGSKIQFLAELGTGGRFTSDKVELKLWDASPVHGKLFNIDQDSCLLGEETFVYVGGRGGRGLPEGEGVLVHLSRGKVFEGGFREGRMEGRGKYREVESGVEFEGEFKGGRVEGVGRQEKPGQWRYEGEFKDGKYHGQGVFTYENNSRYEGSFVEGRFEGEGRVVTTRGERIEGRFKDWDPAGELRYVSADGREVKGKLEGGQFSGEAGVEGVDDIARAVREMAIESDRVRFGHKVSEKDDEEALEQDGRAFNSEKKGDKGGASVSRVKMTAWTDMGASESAGRRLWMRGSIGSQTLSLPWSTPYGRFRLRFKVGLIAVSSVLLFRSLIWRSNEN